MSLQLLHDALAPLLSALAKAPLDAVALEKQFPISSPQLQTLKKLVREGVDARWLCDRENAGVRYSRVVKADPTRPLSVDAVHMTGAAAGHTHPNGEMDLCFAVSGDPRFDGRPEGWTVYAPGTWHVPTVTGGLMDILYFLPGGAIRFEPKPGA